MVPAAVNRREGRAAVRTRALPSEPADTWGGSWLQPVAPSKMAQNMSMSDSGFGLCCVWRERGTLV